MERRLAAILAADVVGYSRMVRADEEGTITALKVLRKEVIDPKISENNGRIVKLMGDGLLAEFASVVDAVRSGVGIQRAIAQRNAGLPESENFSFRVGINLGDVVVDGEDIQGDGVNVAARLEGLAQPGGICVSGMVHEAVRDRIDLPFVDLGEREVKNIARPIRVWQWQPAAATDSDADGPMPLPDKPSFAVLAFENMSGDSEQEYFADGLTEDIITDLSKVSGLFVIARNSSFAFKARAVDVGRIAKELGVRYILEGSVRRARNKVRINAQLIDPASGSHFWAERYDGEMQDIFVLQDRITESIVATLALTLTRAEQDRAMRKKTGNLQAYDCVLRGNAFHHHMTKVDNAKAMEMFEQAIRLDPEYSPAYAGLAWARIHDANQGWCADREKSMNSAFEFAKTAVRLDDTLAKGHMVLGDAYLWTNNHEQAIDEGRKAVALDPSYADGYFALSVYLAYSGLLEEAVDAAKKAIRFNPLHANRLYYQSLGRAHYMLEQYEAAVEAGEKAVSLDPNHYTPRVLLAQAYAQMGRQEDAQRHAREVLKSRGKVSASAYVKISPIKHKADRDHYLDGLQKAGLLET